MSKFILGVIITLVVLILGSLGIAMLGFIPTNANAPPPRWERRLANAAVDASMERHAPRLTNPVAPTDQNGMPAWDKTLSEQDIWKITSLLSHLDKLPPAVQDYYQKNFGVSPQPETKEPLKKADHD